MVLRIVFLACAFFCASAAPLIAKPRISIICSFCPDDPIDTFLHTISAQNIFIDSELILIGYHPTKENLMLINQYQCICNNITHIYAELDAEPSKNINRALTIATGNLVSIMRVEDHRSSILLEAQAFVLEHNPTFDVAYSDYFISYDKNTPAEVATTWYLVELPEFAPQLMYQFLPGPHAMWRKSVHEKYGYFDETFKFSYEWEFWNRCVQRGSTFKKVHINPATYYYNYYEAKRIILTPEDQEKSNREDFHIRSTYQHLWSTRPIHQKRFIIITASYKNKLWYKRNLDSLFDQNYSNYHIIYIDDKSPDETGRLVQEYAIEKNKEDKITVIINEENVGALNNIYNAIHTCKKDDIIVLVDGDDWLSNNDVLSYLNQVYQDTNVWLTYGQFQWYPAHFPGFASALPSWVIDHNAIRDFAWTTTHLRTFYAGLFHKIKKEDFFYDGTFASMAWDLAIMFPMMEMAAERHKFIDEILYTYNTANQINDNKKNLVLQDAINASLRERTRYSRIRHFLD